MAQNPAAAVTRSPFVGSVQTHKGLVRTNNEDSYVFEPERGRFAVIDGMGGQNAGEVAAGLLRDWLLSKEDLSRAIFEANREIFARAVDNENERGMGCVVTAVQVQDDRLHLAHVGDTRAYLARASGCRLLTRDHTAATDRQQQFALSDAVARSLPGQHQITRDVGGVSQLDRSWIVTADEPFEPGDLLMLCSDGLHDLVSSDELYGLLCRSREAREEPSQLARRLIHLALERGGTDNVTVLAVRREAEADPAPPPRRRSKLRSVFLTALLMALPVAGAFAYEFGKRYWIAQPAQLVEHLPHVRGLAEITSNPSLVDPGVAGLDGRLQPGVFVPLGVLLARGGDQQTVIAAAPPDGDNQHVLVRGLELRFPTEGRHRWLIVLEPGATLELSQASIRAPNLELRVELEGLGGTLRITDSHLEIGKLTVIGDPESKASVQLQGGYFSIVDSGVVLETNPGPLALDMPFESTAGDQS